MLRKRSNKNRKLNYNQKIKKNKQLYRQIKNRLKYNKIKKIKVIYLRRICYKNYKIYIDHQKYIYNKIIKRKN